jgi:hypothetical protein
MGASLVCCAHCKTPAPFFEKVKIFQEINIRAKIYILSEFGLYLYAIETIQLP